MYIKNNNMLILLVIIRIIKYFIINLANSGIINTVIVLH